MDVCEAGLVPLPERRPIGEPQQSVSCTRDVALSYWSSGDDWDCQWLAGDPPEEQFLRSLTFISVQAHVSMAEAVRCWILLLLPQIQVDPP